MERIVSWIIVALACISIIGFCLWFDFQMAKLEVEFKQSLIERIEK